VLAQLRLYYILNLNSMNIDLEQETTHGHAVLRRDLLVVCALSLFLFAAMVILYLVNQSTGLLVNLASR
jgi:hypothetical protein